MQPSPREDPSVRDVAVHTLEECLRTEASAVETYELALEKVTHVGLHHELREISASHFRRAEKVRERLVGLGVEVPTSTGVWGAFAKVVQRGADLLGDRAAMAALEAGEDRCLAFYTEQAASTSGATTRKFVEAELLPEQTRTHELCRALKKFVNDPS